MSEETSKPATSDEIVEGYIKEQCDHLPAICKRANSGTQGMTFVKNRLIFMINKEGLTPDAAMGQLESELNEL